jgi:hypothetical protein
MKKVVFLAVLMLCSMVTFAGCSSAISRQGEMHDLSTPVLDTATKSPQSGSSIFDESKVLDQISVEKFVYRSNYWYYAFLVLKNNSTFDISVSASVDFYNAAGNLVGAQSADQEAFEAGSEKPGRAL